MDVYERANRARARMMYCAALARGELTDPLSLRRMEEMRQLSERESRRDQLRRRPMTVVELYVRQESLQAGRSVRHVYEIPFNSAKHPRAEAGQPNGGQFIKVGTSLAGTSADQRDIEFAHEFQAREPPEVAPETNFTEPDFSPPLSHSWKYFPSKEALFQSRFPNPQHYESEDGKHFLVAFEPTWRHAPYAGLHVPELDSSKVDSFLDLLERGSALQETMRDKWGEYSEVDNQINDRGWWFPSFPTQAMRNDWTQRKQLLFEYEQLKELWSQLDAEYRLAGFSQQEVTGFRRGYNDDLRQGLAGGRGLYNAVMAYDQTQMEPLNGGIGVEPTYDEMAIFSAPADALFTMKLGVAALRGSYGVVKEGARFVIRRELPNAARSLLGGGIDDVARLGGTFSARKSRRLWIGRSPDAVEKMSVADAVQDGTLQIYTPRSALVRGLNKIEEHHVFPEFLRDMFKNKYGLDVDNYVVGIHSTTHQALHSGRSRFVYNNKAGWAEEMLMEDIRKAESLLKPGKILTIRQLEAIGRKSLQRFKLKHLSYKRYSRAKGPNVE